MYDKQHTLSFVNVMLTAIYYFVKHLKFNLSVSLSQSVNLSAALWSAVIRDAQLPRPRARPWPMPHLMRWPLRSIAVGRNLWIGDIHGSACAIYGSILCAEIHGLRRYLWIELITDRRRRNVFTAGAQGRYLP